MAETPKDGEAARDSDAEARLFQERLRQAGQLVDIAHDEDTSKLPRTVTHVRYPDGTVRRIRFTTTRRSAT